MFRKKDDQIDLQFKQLELFPALTNAFWLYYFIGDGNSVEVEKYLCEDPNYCNSFNLKTRPGARDHILILILCIDSCITL